MNFDKGRQGPACVIRNVDHGAFEGERSRDETRPKGKEREKKSGGDFYRKVKVSLM